MNIPAFPSPPATQALTPAKLLRQLTEHEDHAPIELIDACAAQGETMVDALRGAIDDERMWSNAVPGEWWLLLHAAFILGRIPSESAGLLLVQLMRKMDEHGDENLQDWLAGQWPALFANKPCSAVDAVRGLAEDRACDGYIRAQALDVVLDAGFRAGGTALEIAIDWEARFVTDESGDWWFRTMAGSALLGFPRERHRAALQTIADGEAALREERGFVGAFATADIDDAFALGRDDPDWHRFSNPWQFYTPEAIAARQERWRAEGDDELESEPDWDVPIPYVRVTPKTGRNEPCPCGSGKKYKRCCLAKDEAAAMVALEQTRY